MTLWKRQNYIKTVKISVVFRVVRGRGDGVEETWRMFQGSRIILTDSIVVHTRHYTFVQTHGAHNTNSKSCANCGLRRIMMCQCKSINHNKRTTLAWDVDGSESCRGKGSTVYGNCLPFKFTTNLRLL